MLFYRLNVDDQLEVTTAGELFPAVSHADSSYQAELDHCATEDWQTRVPRAS
jgi:hypothetical protein